MSTPGVSTEYCRHGIDVDYCAICKASKPAGWPTQHPSVAGHCGKCGAPYTMDLMAGLTSPPKFTPSCRCWNTV